MRGLRVVLGPIAAIWLSCQVGTAALGPVALWLTAADPHAAECSCGHGAGATCPMHHKQPAGPKNCAMQAVNGSAAAVLTAVTGIAGFMPESTPAAIPFAPSATFASRDVQAATERPVPPDPPPPRA